MCMSALLWFWFGVRIESLLLTWLEKAGMKHVSVWFNGRLVLTGIKRFNGKKSKVPKYNLEDKMVETKNSEIKVQISVYPYSNPVC